MQMTFYLSTNVGQFLFKNWKIETTAELFGGLTFVCVLAIILGVLSIASSYFQSRYKANPLNTASTQTHEPGSPSALLAPLRIPTSVAKIQQRRLRLHIARSALHILQVVIGYFLMLAIMTYNGYIAIVIIVASTLTYFIMSPFREKYSHGALRRSDSINQSTNISDNSYSFSESNPNSYPSSI